MVQALDKQVKPSLGVHGESFLPGFVGLNNLKLTDGINVILQALAHVTPLRDFCLLQVTSINFYYDW